MFDIPVSSPSTVICVLTIIRLDIPEYTEPRNTLSMEMSVSKLIDEGGEPGRLLTGHLFAAMLRGLAGG